MSIYHKYNSYTLKKPKLLLKNYLSINKHNIHGLSSEHKRANTELITEIPYYHSKHSKPKSIFKNTQIIKEENKDKVERILHNLVSTNPNSQIVILDEVDTPITHDTKKTIMHEILTLNHSTELFMSSFEKEGRWGGMGKIKDTQNILRDIKEYEARKKYSNVIPQCTLNDRAASIERMFNLRNEGQGCLNQNTNFIHHSLQKR